jgi:hypothetical protein
LSLNFSITGGYLSSVEVIEFEGLLQDKQLLFLPVPGQRLRNRVFRGVTRRMAQLSQSDPIPFACHNGSQNRLSRRTHYVGEYLGQLDIHLLKGFLQMQDMRGPMLNQLGAMPPIPS